MKYNLPYSLTPVTRAGLACLLISQLLSLELDHLAPVTVTFTIVVMWRQLQAHTTACHTTLRILALIHDYIRVPIAPMPAIHTLGHRLIDRGGGHGGTSRGTLSTRTVAHKHHAPLTQQP